MISDYDISVLSALNRIQNGEEIKPKELTSWIVVKKLKSNRGSELENSSVIHSLKKMNELGLINLNEENLKSKIRRVWTINYNNVSFKDIKIDGKKLKWIFCNINNKLFIREL